MSDNDQQPTEQQAAAMRRAFAASGGRARAAKLTSVQRHEIAKRASEARWHKPEQPEPAAT